jgi:hypothetical protein
MQGFLNAMAAAFFLVFVIGTVFSRRITNWPKYLGATLLGVFLGTITSQFTVAGTMAMYIAIGIGFAVAFLLTHTHVLSRISKAIAKNSKGKRIPFLPILIGLAIIILAIIIFK